RLQPDQARPVALPGRPRPAARVDSGGAPLGLRARKGGAESRLNLAPKVRLAKAKPGPASPAAAARPDRTYAWPPPLGAYSGTYASQARQACFALQARCTAASSPAYERTSASRSLGSRGLSRLHPSAT